MLRRMLAVALGLMVAACQPDGNQPKEADELPRGEGYDFFVLSLSWSPSYCETQGRDANRQQCGARPRHAFVVHGLWPQFESGWPEYCASREPERVPDALAREMLDLIPSTGLIGHQWRKHGACARMSQRDYFSVVRAAREAVTIPEGFDGSARRLAVAPDKVEEAFAKANAGLARDGIAVTCEGGLLAEVRICLTKTLRFRSCAEVDARACRLPRATMPAAH